MDRQQTMTAFLRCPRLPAAAIDPLPARPSDLPLPSLVLLLEVLLVGRLLAITMQQFHQADPCTNSGDLEAHGLVDIRFET